MESRVEMLFTYITGQRHLYYDIVNKYGVDDFVAKNILPEIKGMEKAFKVIAGHSYKDHLLIQLKGKE